MQPRWISSLMIVATMKAKTNFILMENKNIDSLEMTAIPFLCQDNDVDRWNHLGYFQIHFISLVLEKQNLIPNMNFKSNERPDLKLKPTCIDSIVCPLQ